MRKIVIVFALVTVGLLEAGVARADGTWTLDNWFYHCLVSCQQGTTGCLCPPPPKS